MKPLRRSILLYDHTLLLYVLYGEAGSNISCYSSDYVLKDVSEEQWHKGMALHITMLPDVTSLGSNHQ